MYYSRQYQPALRARAEVADQSRNGLSAYQRAFRRASAIAIPIATQKQHAHAHKPTVHSHKHELHLTPEAIDLLTLVGACLSAGLLIHYFSL